MINSIFHVVSEYVFFTNFLFILIIVFIERKKPLNSLLWVVILSFMPFIGFATYLIFGLNFRKKRITKKSYKRNLFMEFRKKNLKIEKQSKSWQQLIKYFESAGKNKLTFNNSIDLFTNGDSLFNSIINDLKKAKNHIHLEYFTIKNDNLGNQIADILMQKSKDGIEVKLIIDGVGSRSLPRSFIKKLRKANVEVAIFFPLYFPSINLRINYRTHRKIIIIDGLYGYLGGFNIGDDYVGLGRLGAWRDTHIKISGTCVHELQIDFLSSWNFTMNQKLFKRNFTLLKKETFSKYFPTPISSGNALIQLVGSAPDYDVRLIRDGFLKLILNAKKYIYIQSPYFIPDEAILDALKIASLSGVTIKIMIPNKPDHIAVYWASLSFVGELINYGVDVYAYNNGFLHSKVIIVDDSVASVGSSNFDYRSFYYNFELNSFIYDSSFVDSLKRHFIADLKVSTKISLENYSNRKFIIKFKESISRLLSPIL